MHGTAIAGIIASAANNRVGIVGVAPDVTHRLVARVLGRRARQRRGAVLELLARARARGRDRFEAERREPEPRGSRRSAASTLARRDDRARHHRRRGAARARPGRPRVPCPRIRACSPRTRRPTSATPPRLSCSARPSTDVLTTTPGAHYAFLSGNSLAAANTSGVVALLMERDPHLDVARIAEVLTATHDARRRQRVDQRVPSARAPDRHDVLRARGEARQILDLLPRSAYETLSTYCGCFGSPRNPR